MNIEVIYENSDLIVINKPALVAVHPKENEKNAGEMFVTSWLLANYPEVANVGDDPSLRPGIVHRLDKETSGVMIIAKNQKAFDYLKKQFQEHKVRKTYLALVHGRLVGKGKIAKPIGIKAGTIKRSTNAKKLKTVKEAETEYKVLKVFAKGKYTLIEVTPITGRTHQIRVHFASIHHPIVGDRIYGYKKEEITLFRQFLHAYSIEFTNLDGVKIKVEADLPDDLKNVLSLIAALNESDESEETVDYS